MKKLILSFCLLAGSAAFITSCSPSKEQLKETFVKECKTKIPGTIPSEAADEYCNCSAEKLMAKYSVSEIADMNKKMLEGDKTANADMMKAIQPCLDELTKKAAAQQSQ